MTYFAISVTALELQNYSGENSTKFKPGFDIQLLVQLKIWMNTSVKITYQIKQVISYAVFLNIK